ncbi:Molecular chaperone DjlA [Candidatus Desulfarcum epimagneticum]|uniref:Molecular chaperone DjlA n=1 Tax=uncultured Desulfobacteraceae bacterium TaxID=218296 RepID=A0A484HIY0_9BACT|nr:Molecular chaperone DjlA [uncultured Desulfobacteraceae bacterium]
MSWLGKIVGGTIGFMMGGPIGAVAGAVFGHKFVDQDKKKSRIGARFTGRLSAGEEDQLTFFVATFSMLAKLAAADGNVSAQEASSINDFMDRDLNLDMASRRAAARIFNEALHSRDGFEDFANQFYSRFHSHPPLLDMMIDILLRVAAADGDIASSEESLIRLAARVFRMEDSHYLGLRSKHAGHADRHFAVLGCDPGDSMEKIKSSYRRLVREYHPDAIASKGLPEEFTKFSQEKFQEIQAAYEVIKKERGVV